MDLDDGILRCPTDCIWSWSSLLGPDCPMNVEAPCLSTEWFVEREEDLLTCKLRMLDFLGLLQLLLG